MRRLSKLLVPFAALVLIAAACTSDDDGAAEAGAETGTAWRRKRTPATSTS